MRALVLGANGMLGHVVFRTFAERFETFGTLRGDAAASPAAEHVFGGVSATDFDSVVRVVGAVRPAVVVNCIGIVKQLAEAHDPIASIGVNSLFPHRLARLADAVGARLVHVSTDCVFSGAKGFYGEDDVPDPVDLYGRSKLLGEVTDPPALTIRTSIVGRELSGAHGLVEWFLGQEGRRIRGFARAVFSGWTTTALSRALADVVEHHRELTGLYHVAAEPITKFDLLVLLRDEFGLDVEIDRDADFVCDRSLDGSRFRAATGIEAPPWPEMVEELVQESLSAYEAPRSSAC